VAIFSKTVGNFSTNFTCLLFVPIYATVRIFIQLSSTLTMLCHIKRDHPVHLLCVLSDGGHFAHMMCTGWSRLIWHNFVKVADN